MTDDMLEQEVIDGIEAGPNVDRDTKEKIIRALASVEDPELGIDIVNLGLVYHIDMDKNGDTTVTMTLTAMGCPLAGTIVQLVRNALHNIPEVEEVEVDIVWTPPWSKEKMSRVARIALGV